MYLIPLIILLSSYVYYIETSSYLRHLNKNNPIAETKYGKIQGQLTQKKDVVYYSFKGIPYAKPPIGGLRFKPPEEPECWSNILDATKEAPICAQKNYLAANPKVEGQEDCLYLNVYTPKMTSESDKQFSQENLLPVMVFIHWGGFFTGYSTSDYLGPEYIMEHDVVLVTFNYRLGIFGFLSTNDDASPGNYAFKDQSLALRWVQENIENFGGNKNNVTLFGQSAGAASVHYHMLSPLSRGLFHQAISQSGTALSIWARPLEEKALQIAQVQGQFMGCQDIGSTENLVNCLREKDANDLLNSQDQFKFFAVDPFTVYYPSVEKLTESNPCPFITKYPVNYIEDGDFMNIPWIVGVVTDEGIIRSEALVTQSQIKKALVSKFDDLMPQLMGLSLSTAEENVGLLWDQIRLNYFGEKSDIQLNNQDDVQALTNIYTDRTFHYQIYQTVLLHSLKGHSPIWFYNFDYKGQNSYGEYFAASNETTPYEFGVSHCDDLLYLFNASAIFKNELTNQNDAKMKNLMLTLFTRFAEYGNPTPGKFRSFSWNPLESGTLNKNINYLNISGSFDEPNSIKLTNNNGFFNQRMTFWEDLPLYDNIAILGEKEDHL